ncbi:AMP-dependent synthetase/ligase [Metarhizium album ARSEF 1941]|uniref:AMP-dependent synthetase/ligase n=1 Tax=Metarhizium album (strain ARSEF 1941) TaxID=1081103 RepID=A0A0B2WKJ7_METAS|nr:AMP-dependent synthetase/ligase [Metarhizium album ARSEF 1941]KHN94458.1 AMP-dependent synthetase/ligase [Metarhizium album ARSEF 1941]
MGVRKWLPETQSWDSGYSWLSYGEVAERRKNFGAGLVELHRRINHPRDKYGIGIWAQNRPEWQIADFACMSQGLFSVSLYETLGPDTTEYIINHAELACVVCSLPHVPTLLKLAPRLPSLKLVICIDDLDKGEMAGYSTKDVLNAIATDRLGIQILSMSEVEKLGLESGRPMRPAGPDDLYTINYTSGTTGPPKGVLLTHAAMVAGNAASRIPAKLSSDDVAISYLPLAHILERVLQHGTISEGASCGFFRGDILGLVDDMLVLQPTAFVSVPRLFNRFNTAIRAATVEAEGFRGTLSKRILDTKMASMKLPMGQATVQHWLWDRVFTPKVRAKVGLGRATRLASGSAPLDPKVQEFLSAMFGVRLTQGYGMTETSGLVTVPLAGDLDTGHIGPPSPAAEICLESIPELQYTVDDKPYPRGEILVRGPVLFKGYYKNEQENKKVMEEDGWFHTGDVAMVDELGRFTIIDRKKNVLKLAQGEYVAPERLENVYTANCALIATAFVHGDSQESTLVGIFGISPETFAPFASKVLGQSVKQEDIASLKRVARDPKVQREFLSTLQTIGKRNKFNKYEHVANVFLDVEPFTVENELLTPTRQRASCKEARAIRRVIYSQNRAQDATRRQTQWAASLAADAHLRRSFYLPTCAWDIGIVIVSPVSKKSFAVVHLSPSPHAPHHPTSNSITVIRTKMQSWRYHLYYWVASVVSVLAYRVSAWTDGWDLQPAQVCFAALSCISFMLYFVLRLYGPLRNIHYQLFAATYILGLVVLPHHCIVSMSKFALRTLLVRAFYRIAVGPMCYRGYSRIRHFVLAATLMIALGAMPHPFSAPVANPWFIDAAVHALFAFAAIGALESVRQNVGHDPHPPQRRAACADIADEASRH